MNLHRFKVTVEVYESFGVRETRRRIEELLREALFIPRSGKVKVQGYQKRGTIRRKE